MTKNERSILVTYYESFGILRYLYTSATLTEKERAIKTVETGMIFPGRGERRTKRNVSGAVAEKFRLILHVKTCKTHEWSKPKKF